MHAANLNPQPNDTALAQASFAATQKPGAREQFPSALLPEASDTPEADRIARRHDLDPLIARILAARNFHAGSKLKQWLSPQLEHEIQRAGQPEGLDCAIDVLLGAIKSRQRVAICCDYDVDGTSSAAIMGRLINALGGKAEFFTPDRVTEGYGLNRRIVESAIAKGCRTLLALDFGTSNHLELALAQSRGLRTVVIDHHHIQQGTQPPRCDAFVNPQNKSCGYADRTLCTAGLAYVFAARVVERFGPLQSLDLTTLQGLAALGTVADVVPLSGINRALVRTGLKALADGKVAGITRLAERAQLEQITSASDIGFVLGPRINAAGRVGQRRTDGNGCALVAVELLLSDVASRCHTRAQDLDSMNRIRRELERSGLANALELLSQQSNQGALVVASRDIHEGVAGIIAARLVDRFNLPAIVLCQREDGSLRGSARNVRAMRPLHNSAKPLHLAKLLGQLRVKSGGHAGAAGLSLAQQDLELFRSEFEQRCERTLSQLDTNPNVKADLVTSVRELRALDQRFWEQLKLLEPCDERTNSGVSFGVRAGCVVALESIDGHHSKIIVRQSDATGDAYIALHLWHRGPSTDLKPGQLIDLVCRPIKRGRSKSAGQASGAELQGFELVAYSPVEA